MNSDREDNEKFDLLDVYFFRNLVQNRFFRPLVNLLFFIALVIIIYFGLSSEPDLRFRGGIPFATTMIWDLWHPLLAFTLILLGRLWCFACPIGAVGDWTQSMFSRLHFNIRYFYLFLISLAIVSLSTIRAIELASKVVLGGIAYIAIALISLLLFLLIIEYAFKYADKNIEYIHFYKRYPEKYRNLWFAVILFLFIFAAERHLFMFTRNPPNTALLLLSFTMLAVVMGAVFEKRSFCRYICPIGLVLGVFSMLSAIELRCRSKKTCYDHEIKECVIGNEAGKACPVGEFPQTMERNNYCIMCMECVKSCSKENIRLSPRIPGADIVKSRRTHLDEAYLVHGIIIIFLFVMGMERLQFRNVIINFVKSTAPFDIIVFRDFFVSYYRNMWAIIIFSLITLGAAGLMYLSAKASLPGKNTRQKFIDLSYAFIPLSLSVYLAENMFRLLKGLFYIAGSTGELFGKVWALNVDFETINTAQILLLAAGFLFTLWAGYLISKRTANEEKERRQSMAAISITAAVYLFIGLKILTLPII